VGLLFQALGVAEFAARFGPPRALGHLPVKVHLRIELAAAAVAGKQVAQAAQNFSHRVASSLMRNHSRFSG